MKSAWTVEFSRIIILLISTIIFGLVSDAWVLTILTSGVIYICWTLVQIRALERWIRLGAKTNLAPDSSGIWQLIVQHIHRTQKKNKQQKKRLSILARRFEATIAALPDATIVLNSLLEIEWTNQAAFGLVGIDRKKDLGQRLDNLVRNPALQMLIQSKGLDNQVEIESPIDPLKTLVFTCVDFGEDQKLVIARDISQRLAVQKLRKAFIANASHELRTPLTVISGYLELLDSAEDMPVGVRKQVSNASHQAHRMEKILDDLLTLSKLEEKGHDKEAGENIDMPVLLRKLTRDFLKSKPDDSHEMVLDIDESLKIKAIENEVYSLCQNLISNAFKYSNDGTLINIGWKKCAEGQACLYVQDQGEGIAPEHLSRLTERFYRVNVSRSRQVGGTGLGLSIVKHILDNHGGHLEIKSTLTKGSTFCACFPSSRIMP